MNSKILQVIALMAVVSPICAQTVEKPDGVLGTDYVGVFYTYYNDELDYYNKSSQNYNGFGISVNKNIIDKGKIGVDVGLKYYNVSNSNNEDLYDYTQNSIVASGTVFMKGLVSPFVSFSTYCHFSDTDYVNSYYEDESDTSWVVSGKIGVEIHFLPGLSGTLAIVENHSCDGSNPANDTQYVVSACYWFSSRIGVSVGEAYLNYCHIDEYSTSLTLMYHF